MKLYENVVIGNFLYGLGFAVRAKTTGVVPALINLLQQTPADKVLSDVMVEFSSVVRLIEFKQRSNRSDKEQKKHSRLCLSLNGNPEFVKTSRAIHWFVETGPTVNNLVSRIVPYMDAYPTTDETHSLADFIESMASEVASGSCSISSEQMGEYLNFVACMQAGGAAEGGAVTTGGLLLAVNPKGQLAFIELTDMMQLRLQNQEFVREIQAEMEHLQKFRDVRFQEYEAERQKELQPKLKRNQSMQR